MVQSLSFLAPPSEELLRAERSSMDYKCHRERGNYTQNCIYTIILILF